MFSRFFCDFNFDRLENVERSMIVHICLFQICLKRLGQQKDHHFPFTSHYVRKEYEPGQSPSTNEDLLTLFQRRSSFRSRCPLLFVRRGLHAGILSLILPRLINLRLKLRAMHVLRFTALRHHF